MNVIKHIANATKEAVKGNYGLALKSLPSGLSGITVEDNGDGNYFYDYNGMLDFGHDHRWYNSTEIINYKKAYFDCPPLSAIINRKAQAYTNGVTKIVEKDGVVSECEVAMDIVRLMSKPNPIQTMKQFEAQQYIYIQTFGYAITFLQKPVGFPNNKAVAMWNIPPHIATINWKDGVFFKQDGKGFNSITLKYNDKEFPLPANDIYIFKDIAPSFHNMYIPDSRIKGLDYPINNIIGAYESRNVLINSRGAAGMITNQSKDSYSAIPLGKEEKLRLYGEFKKMYGLRKGQSGVIISGADLKWQNMVMPTKDLMLFEEIEDDLNRICDNFIFPSDLLGKLNKSILPANLQTATRNLYQDAIIPESKAYYEQWNDIFECEKHEIKIQRSYDHLAVLQPDKKEEAEARLRRNQALQIEFRNNVITLNQWRVMNGDEPKEGGDVYYTDIKDLFKINYNNGQGDTNIDTTYINDDLNPRDEGGALNINPDE